MALTATLFTARLQLADQDRHLYRDFSLKLALHPSEQPERLVARLLAWCLFADERMVFTRGLSSSEEPDIWQLDDTGSVRHWIEVGEPDPVRVRKASHRCERVTVVAYTRSQGVWWKKNGRDLSALEKVEVLSVPWEVVALLARGLERQIAWQVTVSEGTLYVSSGDALVEVPVTPLVPGA